MVLAQTARKMNSPKKTGSSGRTGGTGGRKTAGTSKSGRRASGSTRSSRSSRTRSAKEEAFLGPEVLVIAAFAVSAFLFLSNFGICGTAGGFFRGILLGTFGLPGYLVPLLLFAAVLYYVSKEGDYVAILKIGAGILCLLAVCGLSHLMFGGAGSNLKEVYRSSGEKALGGGLLGGALSGSLEELAGGVGAFLIFAVLFIIGIVCITERSLVGFLKERSSEAYSQAREDIGRHRREQAEIREERAKLMEMKKAGTPDMRSVTINPRPAEDSRIPVKVPSFASGFKRFHDHKSEEKPEEITVKPAADTPDVPVDETPAETSAGIPGIIPAETETPAVSSAEESAPSELPVNGELLRSIYTGRDTRTLEEIAGFVPPADIPVIPVNRGTASRIPAPPVVPAVSVKEDPESIPVSVPESIPELFPDPVPGTAGKTESAAVFSPESVPEPEYLPEPDPGPEPEPAEEPEYEPDTYPDPEPEPVSGIYTEREKPSSRRTAVHRKPEASSYEDGYDDIPLDAVDTVGEEKTVPEKTYVFPPADLLKQGDPDDQDVDDSSYRETAMKLQETLRNFGVGVKVTNISCGPTVTQYELHPDQGVKVSRIQALADDIKLSLAAEQIRIEAPIPGKSAVGIEVPNKENKMVYFRTILESPEFCQHKSRICFGVGKDISGRTVVADIAKMPHLLIAGQTGSGKSVCINTLIMSILYKAKPDEVKLIMIDPKIVELSVYNGIPHLLMPVVTDPKKAAGALNWAVQEMTSRYQRFADYGVKDLKGYNAKIDSVSDIAASDTPQKMPQIVIIVDELADLMMVAPSEVEDAICRLAQLARAAGIHLVIATQRPSVNVITGIIKANIPSRIAFSVAQSVDSRTIIDMNGAEKLLGNGDMLFYPSGVPKPRRVQGAFVSEDEVAEVVRFLKEENIPVSYSKTIEASLSTASAGGGEERDPYFEQAGRIIIEKEKASIGMLQRIFKIGFNRAARIMDQLADAGVVGQEEGTKPRKILMTMEEFETLLEE